MLPFLRGHLVNVPEKSKELLHEVQDFIQSDKLYPSVRVEYLRIAFQPKNHDHIRISMDMNVRMIREKTTHFDWYTPEDRLSNEDAILFPFTVVEIIQKFLNFNEIGLSAEVSSCSSEHCAVVGILPE